MKRAGFLLIFSMLAGSSEADAVDGTATPQPNLAGKIANARQLIVENVSQPTRTVRNEAPQFIPNADGLPDILVVYYKGYQGPGALFAVDPNDGSVTRSEIPRGRNTHLQGNAIAANGQLYQTLQMVGGGLELWRYDPAQNRFEARHAFGIEEQLAGQGNKVAVGMDGLLYGTVGSRRTQEAAFYRIDPDTGRAGIIGIAGSIRGSPYAGSLLQGGGGKLYATYGKTPYRLIEFDPGTLVGREVAAANSRGGIRLSRDGAGKVSFSITRAESGVETDGRYKIDPASGELARVGEPSAGGGAGGAVDKKSAAVEKRKRAGVAAGRKNKANKGDEKSRADLKARYIALIREGMSPKDAKAAVLGAEKPDAPSPSAVQRARKKEIGRTSSRGTQGMEIDASSLDPTLNPDRKGRLRYRARGADEWRVAKFNPPLYSEAITQLVALPDNRIFGTAANRAGHFVHDPATGRTAFLGRTGLQHHSSAISGNRVYLSGYPSSMVWSWDFSGTPWLEPVPTKPGQDRFAATPPTDNPRQLGTLRQFSGVHMATSAAADRAGRVYFSGRWYRDGKGGGLGWWDPASETAGGFWESLSTLQVADCCAAGGGRYIVLSTRLVPDPVLKRKTPDSALLCVIDTQSDPSRIARRIIPIPGGLSTGLIAPAGGDRIIGIAPSLKDEATWALYGVDVAAGEIAFTKPFPGINEGKINSIELLHTYRNSLTVAPDGGIWLSHLGVLLRIDPANARVKVIGRPVLDPETQSGLNALNKSDRRELIALGMQKSDGAPASMPRMAFSGNDVYFTGSTWLRRIRGLNPVGAR